ncbi:MAG TPA: Fe-S cluster domain-containing protein [Nitrospirota bacterium]|nr:Fe-S cluster domain-containing protein [Nitrospirota bacterium]
MYEQMTKILLQVLNHAASILFNNIVPRIAAEGSMEATGTVPVTTVYTTLIVLAGLGVVFGVALAIVASRFVVKVDPKVEKVRETLPGANCGACGFAGCMGYAEAVVGNPDVAVSMCAPGKSAVAEKIAEITGKKAEKIEPKIARVFCQGGNSLSQRKFIYTGVQDCTAAVLAAGGDKSCEYGCLGYGTCMRACPFGAITMSADNLPLISPEKCTACGKCVAACPKQVIELAQASKAVVISCHSRDKGVDVKKKCQVGCIACGICVRTCPVDAIKIDNNLARIDHSKCVVCGLCVKKCPTSAIHDYIPVRPKAYIDPAKCVGIDVCEKVCPVNAISGEIRSLHVVNQEKCIGCRMCESRCPKKAITMVESSSAAAQAKLAKAKEPVAVS